MLNQQENNLEDKLKGLGLHEEDLPTFVPEFLDSYPTGPEEKGYNCHKNPENGYEVKEICESTASNLLNYFIKEKGLFRAYEGDIDEDPGNLVTNYLTALYSILDEKLSPYFHLMEQEGKESIKNALEMHLKEPYILNKRAEAFEETIGDNYFENGALENLTSAALRYVNIK